MSDAECPFWVYADDVLVLSETLEDHLRNLAFMTERLTKARLKMQPSKCGFIRKEEEYLGYMITPNGLCPTNGHLTAVSEFPTPQTIKDVCLFLRLMSYYSGFVPGFSKIAEPVYALTHKGAM